MFGRTRPGPSKRTTSSPRSTRRCITGRSRSTARTAGHASASLRRSSGTWTLKPDVRSGTRSSGTGSDCRRYNMASKPVGFRAAKWKVLDLYRCDYCQYAAAGEAGLLRIKRHVAGHFRRGEATWADARVAEPVPERTVPDFASDEAAELAARYGD